MRRDRSAYAALGLDPDADAADIERAYKRLIKLYHPDRDGGDADRAAEINRAYRELSGKPKPAEVLAFHDSALATAERSWVAVALALILALALLLLATGPATSMFENMSPLQKAQVGRVPSAKAGPDKMDQPIRDAIIMQEVRRAAGLMARRDDNRVLDASRECHRKLRTSPTVEQLDRCAAFDDAVAQLRDADPMWDSGPFSPVAVTGRQWSAAAALSNDYLAVDSRLDRIRLQVELALAPRDPPSRN
jgi:curved DNA-binding protein CbpA